MERQREGERERERERIREEEEKVKRCFNGWRMADGRRLKTGAE
jgi:hypothetical protein